MRNAMQAAVADQKAQGQGPSHQSLTRDELAKRVRRQHASKVVDPAAELAAIHSAEDENALPGRPQKTGFRASTADQGGRKEPDYHTVVAKHEHLKEDKLVIHNAILRHASSMIVVAKHAKSSVAEKHRLSWLHDKNELEKELPDYTSLQPIVTVEEFQARAGALEQAERLLGVRKRKLAELRNDHGAGPVKVSVNGFQLKQGGLLSLGKLHAEYQVKVKTAFKTEWDISKRYSEIEALHAAVIAEAALPSMPPKRHFTATDDRRLLHQRMASFQEILSAVVRFPMSEATWGFFHLADNGLERPWTGRVDHLTGLQEAYQQEVA